MRWLLRLLGVVALLFVFSACRVEATITVDVAPDGAGTVSVEARFDPAAVEALDGLQDQLFLGDLSAAGWQVTPAQVSGDGSLTLSASKPVASESDIQQALDDLAGRGVFNDVRLTSTDEFANRSQAIEFEVDLRDGWSLFSDDDVAAALGGEPFGVPITDLTDGRPIDDIIGVTVWATIVGDDEDDRTEISGVWNPRFDDADPTEVLVSSTVEDSTAVLLRWIAIALTFLFGLSIVLTITGLVLERRAARLRPQPTPGSLSSRIPGRVTVPSTAEAPVGTPVSSSAGPVRLVVVEPLSVLYQQSQPAEHYLLPFVRHNDGETRADAILDAHDDLVRGRIETAEFWQIAGVGGIASETDEVFISMRWLRKEAPAFLRELERRRIPIAAITNDAAAWSTAQRKRDRLTTVWPWLVSGEVGAAKPDAGMFERLRRETGTAYGHCLYIDTNVEHLDAARELGMRTALFDADGLELPEVVGHAVVKDLLQLVRRST